LTVLALAGLVSLAFASTAMATYQPRLVVSPTSPAASGAGSTITVSQAQTDDPTARLAIYVPSGYTVQTTAAPGTQLGLVTASVVAADLGGTLLPLTGNVVVHNPANPDESTVAASVTQCTGTATHAAIWVLVLQAAGQTLRVPVAVDPTTGAEATFSSYKLVICLPPPDVPAGTPGRATFGAKLVRATMTLSNITNPAANGSYLWRTVFTPYTPGTGRPNAVGTVEAQSTVALPTRLAIAARLVKHVVRVTVTVKGKRVVRLVNRYTMSVTGIVTRASGASGVRVTISTSPRLRCRGSSTTGAQGTVTYSCGALTKGRSYSARLRATITASEVACVSPLPATSVPGGCLANTIAGRSLTSVTRTVRVPRT
jgi:hypothetical protein